MAGDYRTFAGGGSSEIVEKKSRFLGEAVRVSTQEEAEAFIAQVRKQHYDARHHCFAFIAGEAGTPGEVIRSSDDGEPSGTAGKPLLEILTGRGLHCALLVVTRYFGGTLLGTGGLMRAYLAAGRAAAEAAGTVEVREGRRIFVSCSYTAYGKLQYLFAKEGIRIENTEFSDGVRVTVLVPASLSEKVNKLVTETTDGAGEVLDGGVVLYEER